jgi:sodium-dependent phosphate cotransporter
MVASGTLPLSSGIYIIMGANIGTTITSDIVSLAYITRKTEFRRALAAATVHDFFNIFTAVIILPFEYYYHILSDTSLYITRLFNGGAHGEYMYHVKETLFVGPISHWTISVIGNDWVALFLGLILLFLAIKFMTQIIFKLTIGDSKEKLKNFIFKSPLKSFNWGLLITGGIQSSSITTSLMVPLASTGKIQLSGIFPFIIGANVGTTITAIMAAMFKSDAAISIAIAHLLFNAIGTLIFLPVGSIRNMVVKTADQFSILASRYRLIFFFYILITFFLVPFLLIYFSK